MRWLPIALAVLGIAQFGIMVMVDAPPTYVTLDTAYLVMRLSVIGSGILWALGCGYGGAGCGPYGGGCGCGCSDCAGGDCCGKCDCCETPKGGEKHSHEGHSH